MLTITSIHKSNSLHSAPIIQLMSFKVGSDSTEQFNMNDCRCGPLTFIRAIYIRHV